jgi:glycosyltransferase involved in cell wall biosynthesis
VKFSIITVCYNSAQYIRSAIESVLIQECSDIEYIVIDGGSTDNTISIVEEYAGRIAHIVSEPDKGIYDAMNKGLALASGDVIGILNSDDFYPNKYVISDVMRFFFINSSTDMVLGNVDFVERTNLSKVVRFYSSFYFLPWKLRFGFMPAHPAAFIKKAAYEKVGHYKLDYQIAADYEMFVRMFLVHNMNYVKLNKTLVRMRIGGVSTSGFKSYWIITQEILLAFKCNRVYSNLFFVLLRLPIKFIKRLITSK